MCWNFEVTAILRHFESTESGSEVNLLIDGFCGERLPTIDFPHVICPEASSAQNNIAAVSADGSTVWVLIRRLNSSCRRSIAFVVLCASPLARRQAGEGEEAVAGFLQAVGDGAMTQPPLADEGLYGGLDFLGRGGVDHVGVSVVISSCRRSGAWASRFLCLWTVHL